MSSSQQTPSSSSGAGDPLPPVPPVQSSPTGNSGSAHKKRSATPPPSSSSSSSSPSSSPSSAPRALKQVGRSASLLSSKFVRGIAESKTGSSGEEGIGSCRITIGVDTSVAPKTVEFDASGKYNDEIIKDILKIYFGEELPSSKKKPIDSMAPREALAEYSLDKYRKAFISSDKLPEYDSIFFDNSSLLKYSDEDTTTPEIKFIIKTYESLRMDAQKNYIKKVAESILESAKGWFRGDEEAGLVKGDKPVTPTPTTQEIFESLFISSQHVLEAYTYHCNSLFKEKCDRKPEIVEGVKKEVNKGLDKLRKAVLLGGNIQANGISLFSIKIKNGKCLSLDTKTAPCDVWAFKAGFYKKYVFFTVFCEKKNKDKISGWLGEISKECDPVVYGRIGFEFVGDSSFGDKKSPVMDVSGCKSLDKNKLLWARRLKDDKGKDVVVCAIYDKSKKFNEEEFAKKVVASKGRVEKMLIGYIDFKKEYRKTCLFDNTQEIKKEGFFAQFLPKPKPVPKCEEGTYCGKLYDNEHMEKYHKHPLCPNIFCGNKDPAHVNAHMHICKNGGFCKDIESKDHLALNMHIKPTCQNPNCTDRSSEHLALEHGCIKEWCTNPKCPRSNPEHMEEYLHGPVPEPPVSFENILTKGREVPLNFEVNIRKWMDSTKKYLGCDIATENKEFKMIADWFSGFKDVHQCSLSALKSIKEMGAITSLSVLSNIWRNIDDLARLVWMKPKAIKISEVLYKKDKQDVLRMAQKLVKTYCRVVQGEKNKKIVKTHRKQKLIPFHSYQSVLIPVFILIF